MEKQRKIYVARVSGNKKTSARFPDKKGAILEAIDLALYEGTLEGEEEEAVIHVSTYVPFNFDEHRGDISTEIIKKLESRLNYYGGRTEGLKEYVKDAILMTEANLQAAGLPFYEIIGVETYVLKKDEVLNKEEGEWEMKGNIP